MAVQVVRTAIAVVAVCIFPDFIIIAPPFLAFTPPAIVKGMGEKPDALPESHPDSSFQVRQIS
ncbi:MAG: hypothetical protein WC029_13235 [Sulfuricella sp.]|jgi:hypothetical protein